MPDWLAVVLLGILEGLTEFIPVSSTGHLLLAERWLPRQSDLFNIVIQCGAVLAVLPLFPERLRQCFGFWRHRAARDYVFKIAVAFGLTAGPGLALDQLGFKLPETVFPVALALVLGGLGFLAVEAWLRGRTLREEISWAVVFAVAAGQLIAGVFPGTSRSGATILLALMLGVARPVATEFSFLAGIPTMLSAGGWKIFKALRHANDAPPENWGMLLLGSTVAAVVSFAAVRWLLRYVQTHTFVVFGWYRIVLGITLLIALR